MFRPQLLRNVAPTLRRTLTVHAKTGGNPFIARRADRALPDPNLSRRKLFYTIPIFAAGTGITCWVIFNYQKLSSSVVASTLYSLRVHPRAREALGNEIDFASYLPVISGKMDQLHGEIDISYKVKGTKASGIVRFRSTRKGRMGLFDTDIWTLETADGKVLQLLEGNHVQPSSE
ncbi:cytochrome oxidase complex assembly protein 1-domain-containing protein [Pyronema omphalodes]|nr:cytochrome oxidase complex assembly protein 1-domain-containing protein [Pyronema omphalodes]